MPSIFVFLPDVFKKMRTISAIFVIMAIFASVSLNAQSWTSHSKGLYLNPHTGAKSSVGIGKVPTSDTKLSIQVKGSQSAFRVYDDLGSVRLRHVNGGLVIGEATAPAKNGLRVKGASIYHLLMKWQKMVLACLK